MDFRRLDVVALNRGLRGQGLRKGDLGTIVEVYEPDGLEVEFVTASGRTKAVATIKVSDVRLVPYADLISVLRLRNKPEEYDEQVRKDQAKFVLMIFVIGVPTGLILIWLGY